MVDSLRSAAIVLHGCSDKEDAAGRLRRSISREYLNDAQIDDLNKVKMANAGTLVHLGDLLST